MNGTLLPGLVSAVALLAFAVAAAYWLLLAAAAVRSRPQPRALGQGPFNAFAIAIAAHNEAAVIEETIESLARLRYPAELVETHVVADHCSDETASIARRAGAQVHERHEGLRGGKGSALSWLFDRLLIGDTVDAVVILDADTRVDGDFLQFMNARLNGGDDVIQGQHAIGNAATGWFPALTWAMFLVDNRYQNLGRTNLGWSAKHMGDSICFRASVLKALGWGRGLADDYYLRQRLLLHGVTIGYEPGAIGHGEAPPTLAAARAQRLRWLRGTGDVKRQFRSQLLRRFLETGQTSLLDGVLQSYLPSYSSLTLLSLVGLGAQLLLNALAGPVVPVRLIWLWGVLCGLLFVYPFFGLALERAPLRAYLALSSGPFFILWRSWMAIEARCRSTPVPWVRTTHGQKR